MKTTLYTYALIIGSILLWSCGPTKKVQTASDYPPLGYNEAVHILSLKEPYPEKYKALGTIKIGDSGFTTDCAYEKVIEMAEMEARKIGANVVKITDHKLPNVLGSSCHRITAQLLRVDEQGGAKLVTKNAKEEDSEIADADYALLYIYRPSGAGFAINYNIKLNDSTIFRTANKSKKIVKVRKEGVQLLSAATETTESLELDIKFGHTYYIKTYLTMGVLVGRPVIEHLYNDFGEREFSKIRWRKSDMPDFITLKTGEDIECFITGSDNEKVYFIRYNANKKKENWELKKEDIKSMEINSDK